MARETWTADGLVLTDGLVRDVEYRAGLYRPPAAVGSDPEMVGRHGTGWTPKTFGPGEFVLRLWLGGNSRAEVEDIWDELLRTLCVRHRLVRFTRGLADGGLRDCDGEVYDQVEPEPIGQLGMRAAVAVRVPGAFWRDHALLPARQQDTASGGPLPQRLVLTEFAAATAPMDDLQFTVYGPVTNPTVAQEDTGLFVQYLGTVGAGQSITFNAGNWETTADGFVVDQEAVSYNGYRLLEVPARSEVVTSRGAPTVRLTGSGGGPGTRLSVYGVRKYLC